MPKISIVVPVYNVEKYLEECLESIKQQSFTDFEVIIVDDGSPDNSSNIYKRYAKMDKRFIYVVQENGGVSRARNTGLSVAKGEYIIFIDSDDWMPTDALQILYEKAVSTEADLTVADAWIAYDNGNKEYVHLFANEFDTQDKAFIRDYKKAILAYNQNPMPFNGKCYIPTGLGGPWNKLIKKSVLDQYNIKYDPYVKGIFDDCLFTLEVLAHINSLSYINKPVYFYRMVITSMLHKYNPNILDTNSRIFERIKQHIEKNDNWEDFEGAYSFYVVRRFNETLGTYFFPTKKVDSTISSIRSLKRLINEEPYKSAFRVVDTRGMNKARQLITTAAKQNNAFCIWVIFNLKQTKMKIRR